MINIQQSYQELKIRFGARTARELLLDCLKENDDNISEAARKLRCNRRTVMKAMVKKEQNDLTDSKHTPKNQPKQTKPEMEALVLKWREKTKRGKKRLHKILLDEEKIILPVSTIGKILKRNKVKLRNKKRKHRSKNPPAYDFSTLLPFEKFQYDTKDYLDKQALKQELYNHVISRGLPHYQWTFVDVKSRIRFLAWSYELTRSCGMAFELMVKAWLTSH